MKKYLTITLVAGFFVWLPNAFADSNGVLSIDTPSQVRQVQSNHDGVLLTLEVNNIQVRAFWSVTNAVTAFTIEDGKLSWLSSVPKDQDQVATVYVEDQFNLLNEAYTNLTAMAVISVAIILSGEVSLSLSAVPRLSAMAGQEESLYTLQVKGASEKATYTIVAGNDDKYFMVDGGVLAVSSATVGVYTLSIAVREGERSYGVMATVVVVSSLSLATIPRLVEVAGKAATLYTLTARGGIGMKTYTMVADHAGDFVLDMVSGELSLADAGEGLYTLTVGVKDERGNTAGVLATVAISAAMKMADAPPVTVIASIAMRVHTFAASGGIGVKTYMLVAGDDGKNFTVHATSGVLSLLAGAKDKLYILRVRAVDERNNTIDAWATVGVSAVLAMAEVSDRIYQAEGEIGSTLHIFVASGGIGAKTYTIVDGNDDGYFDLGLSSGELLLTGKAPVAIYTLAVEAKDSKSHVVTALATVAIVSLHLANAPRLSVVVGRAVSLYTFAAFGGDMNYTYQFIAGHEDHHFTLENGVLSVVDATVTTYTLVVEVNDGESNTAQATAVVAVVASLSLLAMPRITAVVGETGNLYTLVAMGGIGAKTYTLVAGNTNYFSVTRAGVLSGTANKGFYTLTLGVLDDEDNRAMVVATVGVSAALMFDGEVPRLSVGLTVSMDVYTLAASGGLGVKTYTVEGNNSFVMVSDVLSWRGGAPVGVYTLSIRALDRDGRVVTALATVVVLSISLAEVPRLSVIVGRGEALHILSVVDAIGEAIYTLVAGDDSFAVNDNSGVLSSRGNTSVGMYTLSIMVRDSVGSHADVVVMVEVRSSLSLAAVSRLAVIEKKAVDLYTLAASGGIGAKTYTLVSGGENYFALSDDLGVLSLLAAAEQGVYTVTLAVVDVRGNIARVWVTVGISAALELDAVPPPLTAMAGSAPALYTLTVEGGVGAKTYRLAVGGDDFALDAQAGILSLRATTAAGMYKLTVEIFDEHHNAITATAMVDVSLALFLADAPLIYQVTGVAASVHTFAAVGGIGAKTYTIVAGAEGELFTLNVTSGVLSMRASQELRLYTLLVQAMDGWGHVATAVATINVVSLHLADARELSVIVGQAADLHIFAASGGEGAKTYTIIAGNDEGYFGIHMTSGVLSVWSSATVGVYTLEIKAIDQAGVAAQAVAVVEVVASLSLATVLPLTVIEKPAIYLYTLAANGGIGAKTYTLVAGHTLYFAVSEDHGVLTVNAAEGLYTLTLAVLDRRNNAATVVATVDVSVALTLVETVVPRLSVALTIAMDIYTLTARGGIGEKTYTVVASDDDNSFAVNDEGVLLWQTGALVGVYTLAIQALDRDGRVVSVVATVEVLSLSLAEVPPLSVIVGRDQALHTLSAVDAIGVATYTLVGDNSFVVDDGVLSAQGTSVGLYTLSVAVRDRVGSQVAVVVVVEVRPSLSLAAVSRLAAVAMEEVNLHTLVASGGIGAHTYTLGNTGYFSLSELGVLAVSNALVGFYTLTLGVMDGRDNAVTVVATVAVSATLALADLPRLSVGLTIAMNIYTLTASGGLGNKTYTIIAGDDGFVVVSDVLSWQTGTLVGVYTLSIRAQDREGRMVTALATVEVLSLSLAEVPRLSVIVGRDKALHTLSAVDAIGAATYTLVAGDNSFVVDDGVLSAQGTSVGLYTLSMAVRDRVGSQVAVVVMVDVRPSLSLAAVSRLAAVAMEEVNLHTLVASGGIGAHTYTLVLGNTGYFSLSELGVLAMSNALAGFYTLTLGVMDGRDNAVTIVATVAVSATLALADLPRLSVGLTIAMNIYTLTASGGLGNKTYTVVAGDNRFTVAESSGVLFWQTGTLVGVYTLSIRAQDREGRMVTALATVEVLSLSLAEVPRLSVIVGRDKALHTLSAVDAIGAATYTLVGDNSFVVNDGVLSAQGTSVGLYTLSMAVRDRVGSQVDVVVMVDVRSSLSLAAVARLAVIEKKAVDLYTLVASGGIGAKTYTLAVGNTLHFGLSDELGVLSVSATAGLYTLTLVVLDENDNRATVGVTVGVSAALVLADAPTVTVIASVAMSLHTFNARGGVGMKTYTLLPTVNGFVMDATEGILSVMAGTSPKVYVLTVQVVDAQDNAIMALATVELSAVLSLADPDRIYEAAGEMVKLHTFAASGGIGAKTYTIVAGNEEYFTLNMTTGVLSLRSGVTVAIYTLSVQAMDRWGHRAIALATVDIIELYIEDAPRVSAVVGRNVRVHTFYVSGGSGARTLTIIAGNNDLNPYFSLGMTTGVLSVLASASVGIYTLTVEVVDGDIKNQATAVVEVVSSLSLLAVPPLTTVADREVRLYTLAARGGIGAKTYTVLAGHTVYFAVADNGVVTVRATAGFYTLTLGVSDAEDNRATGVATIAVSAALVLVEAPRLSVALAVTMGIYTLTADGGIGDKTYIVAGDNRFTVDKISGVLLWRGGMPVGMATLTLGAIDRHGYDTQAVATVQVLSLFLADAPRLSVIVARDEALHTFAAMDAIGDVTYTLVADGDGHFAVAEHSGTLSALSSSSVGIYTLSVKVRDRVGSVADAAAVVEVRPSLSVVAVPWLGAVENEEFDLYTLVVSGGIGTKTYTLHADNTVHFALSEDGVLLLMTATIGSYTLTVEAMDERDNRATAVATVRISTVLVLAEAPLLSVALAVNMEVYTLTARGGIGDKTYTLIAGDDHNFRITNNVLSSRGVAAVGVYTLTIHALDRDGRVAAAVATVHMLSLSLVDGPRLSVIVGRDEALHTFIAMDAIGDATYTLVADGDGHFVVAEHSGTLSALSSSSVGIYTLSIAVRDRVGSVADAAAVVEVRPSLSVVTVPWLGAVENEEFDLYTLVVTGGIGIKTYTLHAGNTVHFALSENGILSLMTATIGSYTLTVEAMDERDNRATAVAIVGISAVLVLAEAPLLSVALAVNMEVYTLTARGGSGDKTDTLIAGDDHNFKITNNVLSSRGVASVGVYTLTIRALDRDGRGAAAVATVHMLSLFLADGPRLSVIVGRDEALHTFIAVDAIGDATYTLVADGDGHFVVAEGSGTLSALSSSSVGVYTLSVAVRDRVGSVADAVAVVEVRPSLSLVMVPRLTVVEKKRVNLYTLVASGGIGAKTYTLMAGNTEHLGVSDEFGVLSVSAVQGFYTLTVEVIDEDGNTAHTWVTVEVLSALMLADVPRLTVVALVTTSLYTFMASGGLGGKTYTLAVGDERFTVNATTGVWSMLSSVTVGIYTLSLRVRDGDDNYAGAWVTVELVEPSWLSVALVPRLVALARGTEMVTLHRVEVSEGYGELGYDLAGEDAGYFAIDSARGELLLPVNTARVARDYVLRLAVSDSVHPPHRAMVAVTVELVPNRIFVLGGENSQGALYDVWSSVDSKRWRLATMSVVASWPGRSGYQAVVHNDEFYVLGGFQGGTYDNEVWSSVDGASWLRVDNNKRYTGRWLHQVVSHQGRLYVAGGLDGSNPENRKNDVWSSVDGEEWSLETTNAGWQGRNFHQMVSHQGRLYVLGGQTQVGNGHPHLDDVWSSSDGATWELVAAGVSWWKRDAHQAVSHNGRLYVMGGRVKGSGSNDGNKNDVWSSVDGKSEVKGNNNDGWSARVFHQAVSRHGLLYVMGGNDGGYRNDVWSSSDGKEWTREKENAEWTARRFHQAVVFPPPLVLWGVGERLSLVVNNIPNPIETLTAQSGLAPYTYSLESSNAGFEIDQNGILSGDADLGVGQYVVTVWVTDADGSRAQTQVQLTVLSFTVADIPPLFAYGLQPQVLHTITASGGFGPKTYKLADDDYFALEATSGVLAVTQAVAGVYTLTIQATDRYQHNVHAMVTVELSFLHLVAAPRLYAVLGSEVSLHQFVSYGGTEAKIYTLIADHDYFSMELTTGVLSISAGAVGVYTISVQVSEADNTVRVETLVEVVRPLSLAAEPLLTAVAGDTYTLTAIDGLPAKTYWLMDDVAYFTLAAARGVLSVQAGVSVGIYTLSVRVFDGYDYVDATITVDIQPLLSLAMIPLLPAYFEVAEELYKVRAGGGIGAWTYSLVTLVGGQVDDHFTVDATLGLLSVQASLALGRYTLSVQVVDSRGHHAHTPITVEVIVSSSLVVAALPPLVALARQVADATLHSVVVSGGYGDKRYTVVGGHDNYFAINAARELLLPMNMSRRAGNYTLRLEVSDSWRVPQRATVQTTVRLMATQIFVLGGYGYENYTGKRYSDVWSSVDGKNWVLEKANDDKGWSARYGHQVVAHQGRLYLSGGNDGADLAEVWSSVDGKVWELETDNPKWPARKYHQMISHNGLLYVIGGEFRDGSRKSSNHVWSSADGEEWTLEDGVLAYGLDRHQALSYGGVIYVMGGHSYNGRTLKKDVLFSSNVDEWDTYENPGWPARYYHQAVVHNGRMYLLGGLSGPSIHNRSAVNDVWSSVDGENWSQEEANGGMVWQVRGQHQAVSRDGRLYVMGGFIWGGQSAYNDVWSSSDGESWTREVQHAAWPGRERFQAVVFPAPLAMVGVGEQLSLVVNNIPDNIYTLTAQSGFGQYTYSLESSESRFTIGEGSGILSADGDLPLKEYVVTVWVTDEDGTRAQTRVHLAVVASITLAEVPILSVSVHQPQVLHTITAREGIGAKTYMLTGGDDGYFSLDATSGVLSLTQAVAGVYTLTVVAMDARGYQDDTLVTVDVVGDSDLVSWLGASPFMVATGDVVNVQMLAAHSGIADTTYRLQSGLSIRSRSRVLRPWIPKME